MGWTSAVNYNGRMLVFGGGTYHSFTNRILQLDLTPVLIEDIPACTLATDFGAFLGAEELSDVVLVLDGGVQIPAHSQLLAMRSACFKAALSFSAAIASSDGGTKRMVQVPGFSGAAVSTVLQYIYTGEAHVEVALSIEVFELAMQHMLPRLAGICKGTIARALRLQQLDAASISQVLELCVRHDLDDLLAMTGNLDMP